MRILKKIWLLLKFPFGGNKRLMATLEEADKIVSELKSIDANDVELIMGNCALEPRPLVVIKAKLNKCQHHDLNYAAGNFMHFHKVIQPVCEAESVDDIHNESLWHERITFESIIQG